MRPLAMNVGFALALAILLLATGVGPALQDVVRGATAEWAKVVRGMH